MSSEHTRLPAFEMLVTAYFDQDWDYIGPNSAAVIAQFVDDFDAAYAAEARDAAAAILAESDDEAEAESRLLRLGLQYDPAAAEGSYRDWLAFVVESLSRASRDVADASPEDTP